MILICVNFNESEQIFVDFRSNSWVCSIHEKNQNDLFVFGLHLSQCEGNTMERQAHII